MLFAFQGTGQSNIWLVRTVLWWIMARVRVNKAAHHITLHNSQQALIKIPVLSTTSFFLPNQIDVVQRVTRFKISRGALIPGRQPETRLASHEVSRQRPNNSVFLVFLHSA